MWEVGIGRGKDELKSGLFSGEVTKEEGEWKSGEMDNWQGVGWGVDYGKGAGIGEKRKTF